MKVITKISDSGSLNKFLCIIFLCICSSLAFANMYCPDEYCSNQYYLGVPVLTLSSSDFPAYTGQNYTSQCQTENSLFELVAYDYDGDQSVESVLIPSLDKISIYNTICSLEKVIVPQFNIVSRPSLVISGIDPVTLLNIYSLVVLTNSTLDTYDSTGTLKDTFNYLSVTNGTSLFGLTCTDTICWAVKQNNSFWVYKFTMTTGITLGAHVNDTARWTPQPSDSNLVRGYSQTINGNSYASYCGTFLTTTSRLLCKVFNATANIVFSTQV